MDVNSWLFIGFEHEAERVGDFQVWLVVLLSLDYDKPGSGTFRMSMQSMWVGISFIPFVNDYDSGYAELPSRIHDRVIYISAFNYNTNCNLRETIAKGEE